MDFLVGGNASVPAGEQTEQAGANPAATSIATTNGGSEDAGGAGANGANGQTQQPQQSQLQTAAQAPQAQPAEGASAAVSVAAAPQPPQQPQQQPPPSSVTPSSAPTAASTYTLDMCDPLHTHASMAAFQMAAAAPGGGIQMPPFALVDPSTAAAVPQQQAAALYNPYLGQLQPQAPLNAGPPSHPGQHFIFTGAAAAPPTTSVGTTPPAESAQKQPQQQAQTIPALPSHQPVYFAQQPAQTTAQATTAAGTTVIGQSVSGQPILMAIPGATLQQAQPTTPQPQQYLTTGATGAPVPLPPGTVPATLPPNAYPGISAQAQLQHRQMVLGTTQAAPGAPVASPAVAPPTGTSPEVVTSATEGGAAPGKKRNSPNTAKAPDQPAPRRRKEHHNKATDTSAGETETAAVVSVSASSEGGAASKSIAPPVSAEPKGPVVPVKPTSAAAQPQDDPPPPTIDKAAYALMSPEEKRRHDRNIREQQRSYKISQQIKELRTVLSESNIPFKPNKFSILLSVVEYIKQLQNRALFLDAEHRKLITTIRQTSEMVNSGQSPDGAGAGNVAGTPAAAGAPGVAANASGAAPIGNDADLLFVHGLDYKAVFSQCPAALGVAALDGRFLACNREFELISGYSRAELARQSLFNLLTSRDIEEFFRVMGEMLKSDAAASQQQQEEKSNGGGGEGGGEDGKEDGSGGGKPLTYWSGVVSQKHQNVELLMNITLTRTAEGLPKFFNCALTTTG